MQSFGSLDHLFDPNEGTLTVGAIGQLRFDQAVPAPQKQGSDTDPGDLRRVGQRHPFWPAIGFLIHLSQPPRRLNLLRR
jgi:hypothetical protein